MLDPAHAAPLLIAAPTTGDALAKGRIGSVYSVFTAELRAVLERALEARRRTREVARLTAALDAETKR